MLHVNLPHLHCKNVMAVTSLAMLATRYEPLDYPPRNPAMSTESQFSRVVARDLPPDQRIHQQMSAMLPRGYTTKGTTDIHTTSRLSMAKSSHRFVRAGREHISSCCGLLLKVPRGHATEVHHFPCSHPEPQRSVWQTWRTRSTTE